MKNTIIILSLLVSGLCTGQNADSALMKAIDFHRYDEAKMLIEKGANVNACISYRTPLTYALHTLSELKDTVFISYLLEKGADINLSAGPYTGTPLYTVATMQNQRLQGSLARYLVTHGALVEVENAPDALYGAIDYNGWEVASLLIDKGAPIKSQYLAHVASDLLFHSVRDTNYKLTAYGELLSKLSADSNQFKSYYEDFTAVGYAVRYCDTAALNLFISKGAKLKGKQTSGEWTLLMVASYHWAVEYHPEKRMSMLKFLVAQGVVINGVSHYSFQEKMTHVYTAEIPEGSNALDAAILSHASSDVITYLRSLGLEQIKSK